MEDFLELFCTIIFSPFEPLFNKLKAKLYKRIKSETVKTILEILFVLILFALVIGIYLICSRTFRGYWI